MRHRLRVVQDRFQTYVAGEDETYPRSVVLVILAHPVHKSVDILFSCRRDAVVVTLEHPVDKDWELVEREHHRPVVLRQGGVDLVALLPPAFGVDPAP